MKLNKKLISFFAIYLIHFFALALSYALLLTFLTSLGYSATERSLFFVADALFGMVMQVVLGYLCDKYRKVKPFLYGCYAVYVVAAFFLYRTTGKIFFIHLLLVMLIGSLQRITIGLLDSFTMEQDPDYKENFGTIRMWGSIGWAIGSPLAAVLVTRFGYPVLGVSFFISVIVLVIILMFIDDVYVKNNRVPITSADIRKLFENKNYVMVVIILFVLFSVDLMQSYTVVDKIMALNGNEQNVGNYFALCAIVELPLFFIGGKLVKKYGVIKLTAFAAGMFVIRYCIYGFATTVGQIFIGGLLQAFTFPIITVTGKLLVDQQTPDNMKVSGQQVALAVYSGGSALIAPFVCGLVTDMFGVNAAMFFTAFEALIGFGLCLLFIRKQRPNIQ